MKSRIERKELYAWIAVIACLLVILITSCAPYQEANPLGTDFLRRLMRYMAICCAMIVVGIGIGKKEYQVLEIVAIMSVFVFRAYNSFYAYNYTGLGLTTIILGVSVCILSDRLRAKVFNTLVGVMTVVSFLGVVCFFAYIIHLPLPFGVAVRADGLRFINYGISILCEENSGMVRLCGIFDEPGWMGTWMAFCLCARDLNLRKKKNLILLFGGILTFSLAFVLLLVIYFFLKNIRDWKRWVLLVVFALFYLLVLPEVRTGIPSVDHVIERMVITSEGLTGDNRSGKYFDIIWKKTIDEGKILWGNKAGYSYLFGTGVGEGIATIKQYVVDFGLVGTAIIFLPLFFASVRHAFKLKNIRVLLFVLISFISLYQRPNLFSPPCFAFYLCGVSYVAAGGAKSNQLNLVDIDDETNSEIDRGN
ncbi:MAG: hypothetical protein K6E71_07765 [Lachnospiraceae bacterium]|nr:hypothetical protein [Lachnospiraceae bacterium]